MIAPPQVGARLNMASQVVQILDTAKGPREAMIGLKLAMDHHFRNDFQESEVDAFTADIMDAVNSFCARILMKDEIGQAMKADNSRVLRSFSADEMVTTTTVVNSPEMSIRALLERVNQPSPDRAWKKRTLAVLDNYRRETSAEQRHLVISTFLGDGIGSMATNCVNAFADDNRELMSEIGILPAFVDVLGPILTAGWEAALNAARIMQSAAHNTDPNFMHVNWLLEEMESQPDALAGVNWLVADISSRNAVSMTPQLKVVQSAFEENATKAMVAMLKIADDQIQAEAIANVKSAEAREATERSLEQMNALRPINELANWLDRTAANYTEPTLVMLLQSAFMAAHPGTDQVSATKFAKQVAYWAENTPAWALVKVGATRVKFVSVGKEVQNVCA